MSTPSAAFLAEYRALCERHRLCIAVYSPTGAPRDYALGVEPLTGHFEPNSQEMVAAHAEERRRYQLMRLIAEHTFDWWWEREFGGCTLLSRASRASVLDRLVTLAPHWGDLWNGDRQELDELLELIEKGRAIAQPTEPPPETPPRAASTGCRLCGW